MSSGDVVINRGWDLAQSPRNDRKCMGCLFPEFCFQHLVYAFSSHLDGQSSRAKASKDYLFGVPRMTLPRTVRTLESCPFAESLQRLLGDNMPTGHHHWWVKVRGLLFRHRTYENGVELVCGRQRNFHRKFVLSGPFSPLLLHDCLQLL